MFTRIEIRVEQARWRRSQIAETFASVRVSAPCYRFAEYVGLFAIVKSELKLVQIQRQIFLAHFVVTPHHSALEQRPERFNRIGMNDAAHVFARAMANDLMRQCESVSTHSKQAITGMFIGRNQVDAFAVDGLTNETIERHRVGILDHLADHVTLTGDRGHERNLTSGSDVA